MSKVLCFKDLDAQMYHEAHAKCFLHKEDFYKYKLVLINTIVSLTAIMNRALLCKSTLLVWIIKIDILDDSHS